MEGLTRWMRGAALLGALVLVACPTAVENTLDQVRAAGR
jgi:hypothetical protein